MSKSGFGVYSDPINQDLINFYDDGEATGSGSTTNASPNQVRNSPPSNNGSSGSAATPASSVAVQRSELSSTSAQQQSPFLKKVYLSSEAFRFCMTQCLSTEVEEVMGLLIGNVDEVNGYCYVTHNLPLKRLDKRKDRVEIGIEQLASSFVVVEELTKRCQDQEKSITDCHDGEPKLTNVQVVGWYHSHPHITVFPSEVDIATHHQYQSTMSPYWLGLIFGVFNYEEASAKNRFQLIAFQSIEQSGAFGSVSKQRIGTGNGGGLKHVIVPIVVESRSIPMFDEWSLKRATQIIDLLLEEEKEAFSIHQGDACSQDALAQHYNACVYSKAISKIITLFGAALLDSLKAKRETSYRLKLSNTK